MDFDALYGGLRWSILERIAKRPMSPLELARDLTTSIANISMHMRVLEAAGVVVKQRIANSKAGEPRMMYSLANELLFVLFAGSDLQCKSALAIDQDKRILLSIWQLPPDVQGPLATFYYTHQFLFTNEYNIYYRSHADNRISLIVANDKSSLPSKISPIQHQGRDYLVELSLTSLIGLDETQLRLIHRGITFGEKP